MCHGVRIRVRVIFWKWVSYGKLGLVVVSYDKYG